MASLQISRKLEDMYAGIDFGDAIFELKTKSMYSSSHCYYSTDHKLGKLANFNVIFLLMGIIIFLIKIKFLNTVKVLC